MMNRLHDLTKPTRLIGENYGTKISVEIDHSDISLDELFDAFQTIVIGMGFHKDSLKNHIIDLAAEYQEDESEYLKEKLNEWKDEADEVEIRHSATSHPWNEFDWNKHDHKIEDETDEDDDEDFFGVTETETDEDDDIINIFIDEVETPNRELKEAAEDFNKAIREFNLKNKN